MGDGDDDNNNNVNGDGDTPSTLRFAIITDLAYDAN